MKKCLKFQVRSMLKVHLTLGFFVIVYLISLSRWLKDFQTRQLDLYSIDDIQQLLAKLQFLSGPTLGVTGNLTSHADLHFKTSLLKEDCHRAPVTNIVYIRTHKTGSTTLCNIINRYGYLRNLSFMLDENFRNGRNFYMNISLAFQRNTLLRPLRTSVQDGSTRPLYNMTTLHTQYDRNVIAKFMVPNARYITSLRDPATQFESAFAHYKLHHVFGKEKHKLISKPIEDSIAEWLKKPKFYLDKLKRTAKLRDSEEQWLHLYARNGQINDLGFEAKHHGDLKRVSEYIDSLDKEFDLVLITEYFDESLLILKKQFCWEVEDILYISENQRLNEAKTSAISQSLRDSIRKWNSADFQLYQHFNRTLWQKIKKYGPQFKEDLSNFRKRLKDVLHNCTKGQVTTGRKFFRRTVYTKKRNLPDYCIMLVKTKDQIVLKIREKQLGNSINYN
ncbi:Galactosylceramide sulfotransferase [Holothuria leucospilota]|uniref:Galactosylceramide sulfotransferase n=1 Tax=Holothuria leucospilota TaxID=206669 RepID=A0A9Q1BN77_HOLLE|nr:Galactosylceramide sulfotransferase [Holothuria leucospilota]